MGLQIKRTNNCSSNSVCDFFTLWVPLYDRKHGVTVPNFMEFGLADIPVDVYSASLKCSFLKLLELLKNKYVLHFN